MNLKTLTLLVAASLVHSPVYAHDFMNTTDRATLFSSADTDGNAVLSLDEMEALQAQQKAERLSARFAALDVDANALISESEFTSGHGRVSDSMVSSIFARADTDSSGALDADEWQVLSDNHKTWWQFARLDADADGSVSETEFVDAPGAGGRMRGGRGR